jgi:predicted nucleic-acid-binding Zn-ribbon protein
MREPPERTVRFPVACPKCGNERLTELPIDVVADALRKGLDIYLVATCHDVIWTATALELEQIQEYLRAVHPGRNDCEFDSHSRQYVRR